LPGLLQEVLAAQRGYALKKNLSLELVETDVPPIVFADGARLRQVLLNLTNNALKFTDKGGITIRALAVTDDRHVRIEIQDTGIGICPEDQEVIFEKFRQSEAFLTRNHEGTGLGLTLAKQLVEHMGGKIGVISTPGMGSTFYIILPVVSKNT
jgi:hypothetical protein